MVAYTVAAGMFVMSGQNLPNKNWYADVPRTDLTGTSVPATFANAALSLDASMQTTATGITLKCRMSPDGLTYYIFRFFSSGQVQILRRDPANTALLPNASGLPKLAPLKPLGIANHVELACVGSTITAFINDVRVVLVTDTNYATGQFSFGITTTAGDLDGRFSNVQVNSATLAP